VPFPILSRRQGSNIAEIDPLLALQQVQPREDVISNAEAAVDLESRPAWCSGTDTGFRFRTGGIAGNAIKPILFSAGYVQQLAVGV
jgi:hypothetical protein